MKIVIEISEQEKLEVMKLMKKFEGVPVSIAKIAESGDLNPNRTRFVVSDLVEEGRLKKILVKDYGPHYRRYAYTIPKER